MVTDFIKNENGYDYIEGIDYVHPEYTQYAPLWQKARDILMGEDELKKRSKREKYLPRLGGHTYTERGEADYNAFVGYAMLYNATGRTVDAYRGLLNRKLPIVTVPELMKGILQDFTIKGESIYTFIEQLEVEVIATNRVGLFIDYPTTENRPLTKAEVKKKNIAPYAAMYTAENIINWEESRINNKVVTSLVVLKETSYERVQSFMPTEITTYRVLELDDNGYYRQIIVKPRRILDKLGQYQTKNVVESIIYPKKNGEFMTEIPFYPITAQGVTWTLSKSIIDDLINVNLAHYRDTAFYEKAIAWTASPTAVFIGLPPDTEDIVLGSSDGLIVPIGGGAKYLEYEGKGLEDIAASLTNKENLMAILGAKILANTANGVESAEAAMIHRAGEQGILADIATTISEAVAKALRVMLRWGGNDILDEDVSVDITKDYTPTAIDANTIIALGNELQRGNISVETYIEALKRGEIMNVTRTVDEELELINRRREGTVLGKNTKLVYLDKSKADQILGREEKLIELGKTASDSQGGEDASKQGEGQ